MIKLVLAAAAILLAAACVLGARQPGDDAAPALTGGPWINAGKLSPEAIDKFEGRVTVLHFWTFACINCRHNLPYYAKWARQYEAKDVQVIGIHTPELDIEKREDNVRKAIEDLEIRYPVLIDNNAVNWRRYGVDCWPSVFLIDKHGRIRRKWEGELQWNGQDGFGDLTREIERLRKEK
jgi:thiol-disulfide isomerase/thioredoxin